jgi:predicted lipid-binding transport protein (Tim44 family)
VDTEFPADESLVCCGAAATAALLMDVLSVMFCGAYYEYIRNFLHFIKLRYVLGTRSFKTVRIMKAIRKHDTRAADITTAMLVLFSTALSTQSS